MSGQEKQNLVKISKNILFMTIKKLPSTGHRLK